MIFLIISNFDVGVIDVVLCECFDVIWLCVCGDNWLEFV